MSLLYWNRPLQSLAIHLSTQETNIVLGSCVLRLPHATEARGVDIPCAAAVTLGGELGFRVEVQGAIPCGSELHLMDAALGGDRPVVFRLRGKDAEGGTWYIKDSSLEIRVDTAGKFFRSSFRPNWISVRAPSGILLEMPHVEICYDASVRLPYIDYDFDRDEERDRRLQSGEGRFSGDGLYVSHLVAGRYRIVSIFPDKLPRWSRLVWNVTDAVSFISGRRADPEITRVVTKNGASIHIHRRRETGREAISPVNWAIGGEHRRAWRMLGRYLQFVERREANRRPRISVYLAELHGALGARYASVRALSAAVAVEGLANEYIIGSAARSKEDVSSFKVAIRKLDLPEDVKTKCCEAIGYMTRANAASRLRALADAHVVHSELVNVWISQRPTFAHGVERSPEHELELYFGSVALCHSIVLGLIGYDEYHEHRLGRSIVGRKLSVTIPDALRVWR